MASRYAIETVFNLIDKVSAPTSKVGKALDSLGIKSKAVSNRLKKDFDKAAERVDKLGKSVVKAGKLMLAAGVAAAGAFMVKGVKDAMEYQTALAKVSTIADATAVPLDKLSKEIIDISTKTGIASNAIAESMYNAIAAGIPTAKAAAFVETATKAAIGGFSDEATVIDGLTSVLNAYGLEAEHATKIADQMLLAQNMGKTSFNEMAGSISKVIPYASSLGMSTEELFASISTLTGKGALKTADAMGSMKAALTSVLNPTKEAAETAKMLGVDFSAAALQAKGFTKFINEISDAAGGNQQIIAKLFGSDKADTAIRILTSTGAQAFSETFEAMQNAAGATEAAFAKMMDTPEKRWGQVMNNLRNSGIQLGTAILPVVEIVIAKIGGIADRLSQIDFSKYTKSFETAFSVINTFVSALFGAVKIAWQFRYVIIAIAAPLALYHGSLMAITIASRLHAKWQGIMRAVTALATIGTQAQTTATVGLSTALSGLTIKTIASAVAMKVKAIGMGILAGATTAYSVAAGVATIAQTALNVALTANPIGVIIMAVAALIGLIILLAKNWNKITTAIKNNTNKVMTVLTILYGPIGIVISMIKEIASNFGRIKEALAATGLFEKIKEIGEAIQNFIKPAIDWLLNVWNTIKNAVSGFFSYVVNAVKSFFAPAVTAIGGFFRNIFNAVYNFVKPALDFIGEKWQQIVGFFKDNAIINAIKVIGGTLLSGILAPVQGLLEILSYIPGLGHLAGKGAEKIQEFRNFLKGVDGATVTAEVNPPENVTLTPPTGSGMETLTTPDFDLPSFAIGGADTPGRSSLHGVVDVSNGAVASATGGNSTNAASAATGAASATNSAPAVLQVISNNVIGIAATLRSIFAAIPETTMAQNAIAQTATTTSMEIPHIDMSGGDNETANNAPRTGRNGRRSPRTIAPVTQAERTASSVQERIDKLIIQVAAEKGTSARIVRAPHNARVEITRSGGNA